MNKYNVSLTMRTPALLTKVWHWHLGTEPPVLESRQPFGRQLARLVPYRFRAFHERYAHRHSLFWLPCVLCDRPFGGHESGDSVPDPTREPFGRFFWSLCSRCTRRRPS